jgi:hypothetical protein
VTPAQRQLRPLGRAALLGFAVASAGGPLCVLALYLLPSAGVSRPLLLTATALGMVLFLAPVAIWRGFSRVVASPGGQYAFVEQAWGRRAAQVQGVVWTVSYLLYLPYTVTYIVFYLLPDLWHLPTWASDVLTLALPVAICLLVAFGLRAAIAGLALVGLAQLVAIAALAVVVLPGGRHATAGPLVALPAAPALPAFAAAGAAIAYVLVCMSLVVFLGGEAADGGEGIRYALGVGYALVAPFTLLAALVLAVALPDALWHSSAAGVALTRLEVSPAAADIVGLIVMAGTAALIIAEFIALSRLWRVLFQLPDRTTLAVIAGFFIAADVVSLVNPWGFYNLTSTPSLIALYLSQAIVFAAYPRLGGAGGARPLAAWGLAVVAVGISLYGLYAALAGLF